MKPAQPVTKTRMVGAAPSRPQGTVSALGSEHPATKQSVAHESRRHHRRNYAKIRTKPEHLDRQRDYGKRDNIVDGGNNSVPDHLHRDVAALNLERKLPVRKEMKY